MTMLKKKHGFTLVELIVVLVILAILLALLVPALTGWIEKARDKQILIDARTAYLAIQTLEDEQYGVDRSYPAHSHKTVDASDTSASVDVKDGDGSDYSCSKAKANAVVGLADINDDDYTVWWSVDKNGKIKDFMYTVGSRQVHLHDANNELVCEDVNASCTE